MGIDLAAAFDDFAVKTADQVGVSPGRVVVVMAVLVLVAVHPIQFANGGTVRLSETENRVAVERESDRVAGADRLLQVDRCDVIVVVVGAPAVATPLVQFARDDGVGAAVVLDGVENGYAVRGEGDGPAEEVFFGGHRVASLDRMQRNLPGVGSCVGLGNRNLLLPGGDANHHLVVGNGIGFHIEESGVRAGFDLGSEGSEAALQQVEVGAGISGDEGVAGGCDLPDRLGVDPARLFQLVVNQGAVGLVEAFDFNREKVAVLILDDHAVIASGGEAAFVNRFSGSVFPDA